jgi:phosphoheptose isomerase
MMAFVYEEVFTLDPLPQQDQVDEVAIIDRGFEMVLETLRQSRRALRPVIAEAAQEIGACFGRGGKVLICGNGGSAAEAQHLTAELVGRFLTERRPLSAISLHAESSSFTAILNDYGGDEVFARQVEAHGRPGDIVILLSTSGTSGNVLHAAKRAHDVGLTVWALTGPAPNPLADLADSAIAVPAGSTAAIQEVHLVIIHAICAAMDSVLAARSMLEAAPVRKAL